MPAQQDVFDGDDPFALARLWMDEAAPEEVNDPNAMALATVDADGMPNVRIVLLKEIEADAFVFYTNYDSAKGTELLNSGTAAFVLHWKATRRQVRVRGLVEREDGAKADEYYHSRPLDSRLGAWASQQSRPLDSRETLMRAVEQARDRFGEDPPRPAHWGGFRIRPLEMEFWADGAYRLHDRERWTRDTLEGGWSRTRLFP
ncbi:Pyridoxamine 5'-phosphate oxidase [Tranquillimonas rosea]|uniref:Pyridoxine/pyridoxamine 5'-phosphate oxidase n=1 Tax=Tranquillimonas rosea TaxID=641238 RepID=A0A1H9V854_9RHOB|nr:pyridoxamine 5'-phosphate oxidase [Tranquillimonas rosea]SES17748.1 Pyridoxamine 5'-phosphate oxidase [Tranquillimonas rosea]